MKKTIITLMIIISSLINANTAIASEYSGITYNTKIINALNLLKEINADWVVDAIKGNNLSGGKIRVKFTNLGLLSPEYSNYNALACRNNSGNFFILIDSKHQNAPAEAIASLLSHEVIHQDDISSIAEETQGWMNETTQWMKFKKINPQITNIDCALVKRLNKLETMYKTANNSDVLIRQAVAINEGYVELAMNSPGY